jgi:hypothetical protein
LFSAVSSAFVIDVQSGLQPDSSGRSEAYLRAILLTLNRSIVPDEDPAAPPVWNGPPAEIVTTSNLLYASLLMSLLAAFVAMLGKQWLNRYLRHTGGSMIERCGDRQRKFDGLEKWPFRLCMESLPIMLQVALLLLACGLSRYIWSVNTSVGRVVVSFTIIGVLFYLVIVIAGTLSHECPFQTPASMGLRGLKNSETTQKMLASLFLRKVLSFTRIIWKALVSVIRSTAARIGHQAIIILLQIDQGVGNAKQRLVQGIQRFRRAGLPQTAARDAPHPPPPITSGIRTTATKVGHQIIILLLRIDRVVGNVKQRLLQGSGRTQLLPTTIEDAHHQPHIPRHGSGLLVHVRNLDALRNQNEDNARCVCWVSRNITDPEAIDFDIRLAGIIRWFDGHSDHDPPFDLIVSAFEECFDAAKQLYPAMRDRAYFSARAILQINVRARVRSSKLASKYHIPAVSSSSVQPADTDLHHILRMLERNSGSSNSTLDFPNGTNTRAHSLWVSNLFVDLTRVGSNPILKSYGSYLSVAAADHQATIANVLLIWYMFLGGNVEEETFWAVDKSYAVVSLFFLSFSPPNIIYASDSMKTILTHLSARVINTIADGNGLQHLNILLEFLAAWEKRPAYLTPMAYQWCSAISEAAGGLRLGKVFVNPPPNLPRLEYELQDKLQLQPRSCIRRLSKPFLRPFLRNFLPHQPHPRLRLQDLDHSNFLFNHKPLSEFAEREFSHVGLDCDPVRVGDTSHHTCACSQNLIPLRRMVLLPIILEIGFRLARPDHRPALHLTHTPHHEWMFKVAFSSDDDEVIADAVNVWVTGGDQTPPDSFVCYLAAFVGRKRPFSPRLRQAAIRAIEPIKHSVLEVSGLETIRLLNRLNVHLDEMVDKCVWARLLAKVICLPAGSESLSPHYWRLLEKLALATNFSITPGLQSVEVMRSLEEAGDWERLEVWTVVVWQSLSQPMPAPTMEDVERVTLKLLSQRPSAPLRFETLCKRGSFRNDNRLKLQYVCDRAQKGHSPSEPPPLLYVSICPSQHHFVLMPLYSSL